MQKHVANATEFIEKRQNAVIVQADHMPTWLRLGRRSALFADRERFTKAAKFARAGEARYKRTSQKLAKLAEVGKQLKKLPKIRHNSLEVTHLQMKPRYECAYKQGKLS